MAAASAAGGRFGLSRRRGLGHVLGTLGEAPDFHLDAEDIAAAFEHASGPNPNHDLLSLVAQGLGLVPGEWSNEMEAGLKELGAGGELDVGATYEAGGRLVDLALHHRLENRALGLRLTHQEGVVPRWERYVVVAGQQLPALVAELITFDEVQVGLNLMFLGRQHLIDLLGNMILLAGHTDLAQAPSSPDPTVEPIPEPSAILICAQCGARLSPGLKFCEACGAAVEQAADKKAVCPNCGEPLAPGLMFCTECGAKVG
jgi:hypothetical protein